MIIGDTVRTISDPTPCTLMEIDDAHAVVRTPEGDLVEINPMWLELCKELDAPTN